MTLRDYRDHEISGATPAAREAFERALLTHLSWRTGAEAHLAQAVLEAPTFTMAHVLRAYLSLCSRDVARVREARAALAHAANLPATPREQLHLAGIGAALADDFESFNAILQMLLAQYPRDIIALQIGHALDYATGDVEGMAARIAAVLPAWSPGVPGYHAVLAMQAFSLGESGRFEAAADLSQRALELNASDVRAHHALTHVFEMTGNAASGDRWMRDRLPYWSIGSIAATHLWWHWALFHLTQGNTDAALELYDQRVRAGRSAEVADMIDASALLWRIELLDVDTGRRWLELAAAWSPHIEDGYCTFSDLHAMVALVGARDFRSADRLERQLFRHHRLPTRYGETTRLVGLPAARAVIAFGRGEYARASKLLGSIPSFARSIGGSQAQRDLLYLTLLDAVRRLRRPVRSAAA
jgi:tetratricopeptide (TPR) repeat protein